MAILKFGALVAGARGTIGGVVYTAGRSGPYARTWARGANPRTARQSAERSRMSQIPSLWASTSPTQRGDWDTWAADPAQELTNALGEPYYISGYSWFTTINIRLLAAGLAARLDPPTTTAPAIPIIASFIFEFSFPSVIAEVTYDPADFDATDHLIVFCSPILGAFRAAQYRGFVQLSAAQVDAGGVTDFAAEYIDRFGVPQGDTQAFLTLYRQDDEGMRSAPLVMSATYVA